MTEAKWEVSRSNWKDYASMFEHIRLVAEKSKVAACDYVDEWDYRKLICELENLERFARENADRLNCYERL